MGKDRIVSCMTAKTKELIPVSEFFLAETKPIEATKHTLFPDL
jgi:hypothetical protein